MTTPLSTIERETGANPTAAVIWLHGLGADANDFVPLVPELRLPVTVRFVFPNAPVMPVTINNGMSMRAWYDILHFDIGGVLPTGAPREDEKGLRASQSMIDALIADQIARGIPASRILIAGFSQGAAMTLLTGLRHRARLAGLIALSGYLPLATHLATERAAENDDVPIFMAHGSHDPVVRIERAIQSRDALLRLGYTVDWHTYPMQHAVCAEEVAAISAFVQRVLA